MSKQLVIISGASTGIGKATAIELGKMGYSLILIGRNRKKLEDTKNFILSSGGEAWVSIVDLSNKDSVNEFLESIKPYNHTLHSLVNIAGVWHDDSNVFANTDFDKFSQNIILDTLNVGITSPILLAHGLIPLMKKGSTIVNLSGTFENGAKGWLPYYISKKAIESLTIGLSEELANREIYVNCVSPSDTSTEEYERFFPEYIDLSVTPEDVAKIVVKYVENQHKVSGQIEVVKKT